MRLAIIVPQFTPCDYQRPRDNFLRFREAIGQPFVHMLAATYLTRTFRETKDIIAGDKNCMWQKEALINEGIRQLPSEFDAVCWIDGDLLFQNPDWYAQTCAKLEQVPVVQMFEKITYLDRDDNALFGGYGSAACGDRLRWKVPGGAIACRREILDDGIYDRHVLGCGDDIFMSACTGTLERCCRRFNPALTRDVLAWGDSFGQHEVGFVPGEVHHLWHGDKENRQYADRHRILAEHDFDPATDVRVGDNGLLEWSSDKPALHAAVREFFAARKEDGSNTMALNGFNHQLGEVICQDE
jgi:hypothetical protein